MAAQLHTLKVGKLADLTVLKQDLTKVAPSEILNVQVERVMVDGVWQS